MKNFLLEHGLELVLSKINTQSKKNKKLVAQNFSFIEEEGGTELLKQLLMFLQKNKCVSFKLILACFRVQNFEKILNHFEILLANDLISNKNLMLVLKKEKCQVFAFFIDKLNIQKILSQKSLHSLRNSLHSPIRQQVSEMISAVGINDNDSLLQVWEHDSPETLLHALELFSENDDVQLETVFKIAECLELNSLTTLVRQIYDEGNFDIKVIKEIALNDVLINEKRERLSNYFKSFLNKDETIEAQFTTPYLESAPRVQHMIYNRNAPTFFTPEVTRDSPGAEEEMLNNIYPLGALHNNGSM